MTVKRTNDTQKQEMLKMCPLENIINIDHMENDGLDLKTYKIGLQLV